MKTRKMLAPGNRVAGLLRVSDQSQVEGHSLEAQASGIEKWCQQRGLIFYRKYMEAGVSAHTDEIEKRPELLRALGDAEKGEYDFLIVHTLDRLARKLSIQMQALKRLGKAGVGFASVNDPIDATTPMGRLMLNYLEVRPKTPFSPIFALKIVPGQRQYFANFGLFGRVSRVQQRVRFRDDKRSRS